MDIKGIKKKSLKERRKCRSCLSAKAEKKK
jgi:hypothetical protein